MATPDPPTSWGNPLPPDHNPRTRHSVPDILESTGPAPLRPSTLLPFPSSHHHSRGSLPTPSTDFPAAGGSPIDETASINSLSPCNTCEELDLDAVGEQFLYEVGGNIGEGGRGGGRGYEYCRLRPIESNAGVRYLEFRKGVL